ncbi:MINDY family deubiquitinase Ecym_2223 [Eremothecium cymbalariae DBVPG|uniref:MINDY deubiquitinase domain-containing protein n=1 Tax=Eremothecium cymbalariae (strain CBS 270.75 / DBVPG 7215 / KCTC 17166 / NRRL Y-17582) TaxID=931890 RepID=G8JP67_ERECY|nr:Hypothetical protein Ecym_2223 [Eremothecium cymbalariae DBVPG\
MSLEFETKQVAINGRDLRILLQNENGPCALIALSNVLLICPNNSKHSEELKKLVEQPVIKLQDLVTALADIAVQNTGESYKDTDQLLRLLPQLHTGLSVNPAFDGSFTDGAEMSLFRLFQVSLVHGWLLGPENFPQDYEKLSRYSYEDAQKLIVQSHDIQQGIMSPTVHQHSILKDAQNLRSFFARSATQLTTYGLQHLKQIIMEGSYAVLFRNDHFATICKQNGELFTLVTDLGYKYRSDIVWQSLSFVNGSGDTFHTGEFIPTRLDLSSVPAAASYAETAPANPFADPSESQTGPSLPSDSAFLTDEELARHLQQEEDNQYARAIQRSYNSSAADSRSPSHRNCRPSQNSAARKQKTKSVKCV